MANAGGTSPLPRRVLGIDFGTSFCCVAVWQHGGVKVVKNEIGVETTPSCVAFTSSGDCLIGNEASSARCHRNTTFIFDIRRLIGRRFDDPIVQKDMVDWPFKVIAGTRGEPLICVRTRGSSSSEEEEEEEKEKKYTAEELAAMLLGRMKDLAEAYLNGEVTDAVITVPAYFNRAQIQATKDAGAIAGLNVLRVMNEPTAAALAYGLKTECPFFPFGPKMDFLYDHDKIKMVMVFDLGGRSCDVSILEVGRRTSIVRALSYDTCLGGVDFDKRLVSHVQDRLKGRLGTTLQTEPGTMRRSCVDAKHRLSTQHITSIVAAYSANLSIPIYGRAAFEELNKDLFDRCMALVRDALANASMEAREISDVILVGGSTLIPKIQSLLTDFFRGRTLQKWVNPDVAVARGAAIMAAILTGENSCRLKDLRMLEATPLSLGISVGIGPEETHVMSVLIPRNTPISAAKTERLFFISEDNQLAIDFGIFQGERALCKDNQFLGSLELDGFEPAAKGVGKATLTLSLDEDGILHVEARDVASGRSVYATIPIMPKGRLTSDDIKRIVDEAQTFKSSDKLMRKRWAARDELDDYARSVLGRLLSEESPEKKALKTRVDKLLTFLHSSKVLPTLKKCERKRKELEAALSTAAACATIK